MYQNCKQLCHIITNYTRCIRAVNTCAISLQTTHDVSDL